ncbi:hypothetical protein DXG01_007540 [Tephrocybe rancida]|nr:hypothetical protein DXG01_007540 [Tephrocybe rancida]
MPVPTTTLDVDPLAKVLEPPPNETPEELEARLLAEAKAKRVSEGIDEELEREKAAERAGAKALKILLLVMQARPDHNSVDHSTQLESDLLKLKMRLAPLLQVEQVLIRRLAPDGPGEAETMLHNHDSSYADLSKSLIEEVAVNSTRTWKETVNALTPQPAEQPSGWDDPNDPGVVLNACSQDMQLLWNDLTVRTLLKNQSIHMEQMAVSFLDSLDRVTAPGYVPSDDDVLRARLKTLGASEHRFKIRPEHGPTRDWRVFDVGGHRSLSSQQEDSVNIWNYIVKNELLKNAHLILFMNKIDILKAKLQSGVKFSDYVVSYGARRERENDVKSVTRYLKEKFCELVPLLPIPPPLTLSQQNIQATKEILTRVKDVLMRKYLEDAVLI